MTGLSLMWALITSFAFCGILSWALLPYLRSLQIRKEVRIDTPASHQAKIGTPSMGGVAIILSIALSALLQSPTREMLSLVATVFYFGMIGLLDDMAKARGRENRGLRAREKLALQTLGCLFFYLLLERWSEVRGAWVFLWAGGVILGMSNAANLADGLDGLAAGLTALAAASLGSIAAMEGEPRIAIFAATMAGASAGFLLFNARPALIFMGDTGSLALGAALATSALAVRRELLLPLICLPFVIEAMSVILQVACFKTTGKRIFRMAPIHHGFELRGWSEWQIVVSFWIVGLVSGVGTAYFWQKFFSACSASLW